MKTILRRRKLCVRVAFFFVAAFETSDNYRSEISVTIKMQSRECRLSCIKTRTRVLSSSALTFTVSASVKDRIDWEFRRDSEVRKHEKLAYESRRSFISRGVNANQPGRAHIIQSERSTRLRVVLSRLSSRRRTN